MKPRSERKRNMTDKRFEELVNGPLSHPMIPFKLTRLMLALRAVVEMTGQAGEDALEAYCRDREAEDRRRGDDDEPELSIAKCCACGESNETVRNIVMLDNKTAEAGTGWGCVQCGLASDGAVAVLCDLCAQADPVGDSIREAVVGYMRDGRREPIAAVRARPRHEHDMTKHPEVTGEDSARARRAAGALDDDFEDD